MSDVAPTSMEKVSGAVLDSFIDEYQPGCEMHRMLVELREWRRACTGKHGSQASCVSSPAPPAPASQPPADEPPVPTSKEKFILGKKQRNVLLSAADALEHGNNLAILAMMVRDIANGEQTERAAQPPADELPELQFRIAALEQQLSHAPIVCVRVVNDMIVVSTMYAPGLPDGEHDLFAAPVSERERIAELEKACETALADGMQGGSPLKASTLELLRKALGH